MNRPTTSPEAALTVTRSRIFDLAADLRRQWDAALDRGDPEVQQRIVEAAHLLQAAALALQNNSISTGPRLEGSTHWR